ncbi:hypothetical protein sscle_01g004620 [Sclerotinia sclerotiorum 1980 UF-70]|uniref:Uncharacterized protein n=1 Tax=Sclerotinia sclerotiorum (strain ATCC 18683 / 1980 / Ss-1) TaxID=665079 RepID=A0A1D9PT46_SCLS1|nr:hypothetical protein sscle_01g004620 [Sclerotinia sclerotiorum 1980 UF-70]
MQFQLTALLLLLPLSLALPEPVAEPVAVSGFKEVEAEITPRDGAGTLVARACSYTTGCVSQSGASAGKYCGFCKQVRGTYRVGDIYQVNGGSGSSSCCSYGASSVCAARWPAVSPNVLVNCANNGRGY